VGLGNFLAPDVSPWELLMATGLIYALPPGATLHGVRIDRRRGEGLVPDIPAGDFRQFREELDTTCGLRFCSI
jgi:hypothetical protein